MREPWLYCPDVQPGRNLLPASEAQHAVQSLRLRPRDTVVLFDGHGHLGRGTLVETPPAQRSSRGRQRPPPEFLVQTVEAVAAPARSLTLIVPACKGARLDWLIEKGTELGVARFLLTELEHSVVHAGPQHEQKLTRTSLEACKQCRRPWLPQIQAAETLAAALDAATGDTVLVAHIDPHAPSIARYAASSRLVVVVGPEGGLSERELVDLQARGGQVIRLADYILRVETAGVAVAAQWAGCSSP